MPLGSDFCFLTPWTDRGGVLHSRSPTCHVHCSPAPGICQNHHSSKPGEISTSSLGSLCEVGMLDP